MIVKLVWYYDQKVFSIRKYFKEGFSITQSLTSLKLRNLKKQKEKLGLDHVWTTDSYIMIQNGNAKPGFYYG